MLVEDSADFESPGEAYFHFLAVQALNAAIALESGANEDEVKHSMSVVVADAVDVILGRRGGGQG